ncbi:probable multidrug resistance-associated protein lethal(2)03659 isoform X1 [Tribolium castaneum]|uniref:probable multidrug resistance-associated protein lethal(2)03659 isoform X1 n=2 Tax=Tribolium castaneum TaxID=7070 RepID=UPI00077D997A|nr:PREDICTED: probable multidrug resistance-associated protein lethal(2)03659 isoform X1 [Tribolium castaneum]|eukprot:XP_015840080.1 PREDICTED: probable multidrug resistance-associated protein lethal(2)03659 isoform X1 [Tribolium castaneum]
MEHKTNFVNKATNPRKKFNFLSHVFFSWQIPLIIKTWKQSGQHESYFNLDEHDSEQLGNRLEFNWKKEGSQKKFSFKRALIKTFGHELLTCNTLFLLADVAFTLAQPMLIKLLLDELAAKQTDKVLFYVLGLLGVPILRFMSFHLFCLTITSLGLKLRIACSTLIYRKILTMRKTALEKISLGNIVNLLSNDTERFDNILLIPHIWLTPIKLIAATLYLGLNFDYSALTGIGLLVILLISQSFVYKNIASRRMNVAKKTDQRIRWMNDFINGIQAIKMYTWEKLFEKFIFEARESELKEISKANYLRCCNNSFRLYLAKVSVYLCIMALVLVTKIPLTSSYIFALIAIYEILRLSTGELLLVGVIQLAEIGISVNRIETFLLNDIAKSETLFSKQRNKLLGVYVQGLIVKRDTKIILEDVNFEALSNQLVALVGAAGAGKSTFLETLLKETEIYKGIVDLNGSVSYAPQEPWIFSSSVKQNIIFCEEFDEDRYRQVIKICGLEHDLALLSHGDNTLVGENGVMLSGGQKARISLARAVYRNADIYLLDDPLSAVDVYVAKQIFEQCIVDFLKGKCVVLVTHQLQFVRSVEKAYFVVNGKIVAAENTRQLDVPRPELKVARTDDDFLKHNVEKLTLESNIAGSSDALKKYLQAGGTFSLTLLLSFLFILTQSLSIFNDYFLAVWVNLTETYQKSSNYFYVYSIILFFLVLVTNVTFLSFVKYCMRASRRLHDTLLRQVIRGSMTIFHSYTSGRIFNLFSKDIGVIDEFVPLSLYLTLTQFLLIIGSIVFIFIVNYWMILPIVALILMLKVCSGPFRTTIKSLRRLEAIRRNPIYNHVVSTMQGITVIKSSNSRKMLEAEFSNYQNDQASTFYLFKATHFAFAFWTDIMSFIHLSCVILFYFTFTEDIYLGNAGMIITHANLLNCVIQYFVKLWGELDANLISVERVSNFQVTQEFDEGVFEVPQNWPLTGKVVFDSVSMRYSSDKNLVLNKVDIKIKGGEKVGIVGRTGAGKSSLILALFRLFHFDGSILIDNVDTKSIPLQVLRSNISVIPQDPVLFQGSLRKNLDPFDEFSDAEVWTALEDVQLKKIVKSLDIAVNERGSNFSVGQKQLLCLARAILKKTKVIAIDEATANVDYETDVFIQNTIRIKFRETTVLTIAHRVNTILDSDKILVMEEGRVVEFGPVEELMKNVQGQFYRIVKCNDSE